MIKLVIFDFDGTLVDSREVIYHSVKKFVEKECCPLGKNFKKDMGDWPLEEQLRRSGINKNRGMIVEEIKSDLGRNMNKMKPARGLRDMQKIDVEKVILSNNSDNVIRKILRNIGVNFFKEIHSPKEFHNKAEGIKKVLKKKGLAGHEAVYVGDRDKDMTSAKKAGCYAVAVSNKISWSTREELLKSGPDFIISDLRDIRKVIRELNSS